VLPSQTIFGIGSDSYAQGPVRLFHPHAGTTDGIDRDTKARQVLI